MKVAVLFIRSRITPLFLIKKPASHSSDSELDMVHGTPSSDKSVNELDYSVVSDSKNIQPVILVIMNWIVYQS